MTDRENFLRTARFRSPERIMSHVPSYSLYYRGCHHEDAHGVGHDRPVGERWRDIWGVGWQKDLAGVMGFPREHPLADIERVADYDFPNPDAPYYYAQIFEQKARFLNMGQADLVLSGSHRDTLWERAYMLVGMEALMTYFYTHPDHVRELLRRIMDFQMKMAEHYVAAGVEHVRIGDDLGTQTGLLLSGKLIEEFLMPQYERLVSFYKRRGVLIHFHCCGHIEPMLGRIMELGIDILDPVQATANDLERVRRVTRGRLVLEGAVESHIMLRGDPAEIEARVKLRIEQLGQGGYICAPDQSLPYTMCSLNILERAVQKYGRLT